MFAAIPEDRSYGGLPLNSGINASNSSTTLPMDTLNTFDVTQAIYGKSAGFGNTTSFNGPSATPSQAVPRSDVQRYALQNQLKAMYDAPVTVETLGQKLFATTLAAP